jgi:hypothetical protein
MRRAPRALALEILEKWQQTGPLRLEFPTLPALFGAKRRKRARSPIPRDPGDKPWFPHGICWAAIGFRARRGAKPVLALHHLVTAPSVKKRLMELLSFVEPGRLRPVMQGAHSFVKIDGGGPTPIASAPS